MYFLLLAVIYLAFISLGLPDSLLGSVWPSVHTELNIPTSYMGILSVIISGLAIITSLLSEKLTKRFSTVSVTAVSILLTAIGMYGFSLSKNIYQLCFWTIPYGIGGGAIDAALNNYVAQHYSSKHINWLHCFWGVGTIISPYIMGYAIKNYHWSLGYKMVALLQIIIFFIFLLSFPLWQKDNITAEETANKPQKIRVLIKIDGVKANLIAFCCYCCGEATCMYWSSSYLEALNGLTKDEAANFGSLFFIGITCGRLISGFLSEWLDDKQLLKIGNLIAIAASLMIIIPNKYLSVIGFVLLGLGCGPIYPCILHATIVDFDEKYSHGIIGFQMAFAYIGSTTAPALFAQLVKFLPIRIMPLYLLLFFVVLLLSYQISSKQIKKGAVKK
ncbi:MAG: MFS transporter [Erysipelotrichaceae bacterium]